MANACLYSGGKDSTLALHKAIESGIKIDLLITFISKNKESYMFHYTNVHYSKLQAEALGIRQVFVNTEGEKEKELADLEKAFVDNKVKLLVTGATYSRYQADRIKNITDKLGIENLAPLWHIEPIEELNELAETFDVIISSVSAEGLDESFLGRRIDNETIEDLKKVNRKYGINLLFEGGEAESFVLDAPLFNKKIRINRAAKEWHGTGGIYIINDAELVNK